MFALAFFSRVNNYLVVSLMLLADVFFIAVAPWFTSLVPMLATLSPPEFFNSVIGMGDKIFHSVACSLPKKQWAFYSLGENE